MTVMAVLAFTKRLVRGGIAAVGRIEDWIIFLHGVGVLCVTHLCC